MRKGIVLQQVHLHALAALFQGMMLQRNGQIPSRTMLHQIVHSTTASSSSSNRKRHVSDSMSSDCEGKPVSWTHSSRDLSDVYRIRSDALGIHSDRRGRSVGLSEQRIHPQHLSSLQRNHRSKAERPMRDAIGVVFPLRAAFSRLSRYR